MSATLRQRCQTSLGAGSRCKGSTFFWIVQIKMPFMRILHKWQGGLLRYIKYVGQRYRCGLVTIY